MIRILYFASLRERLGRAEETLQDFPETDAVDESGHGHGVLLAGDFADEQRVLAAVNQEMASVDRTLQAGDEVGFFPPVTGG